MSKRDHELIWEAYSDPDAFEKANLEKLQQISKLKNELIDALGKDSPIGEALMQIGAGVVQALNTYTAIIHNK